jgi:hypothetical protein
VRLLILYLYIEFDWITNYTRVRTSKLFSHLNLSLAEQTRIADVASSNDFSQGRIIGNSVAAVTVGDTNEESFDPDDDMYNRKFVKGQFIDF